MATILPLERNVSRKDIECPGDVIPFHCIVQSNSETVHLKWRVTLPGQMPVNVTYDATSSMSADHLNKYITTELTAFESDVYAGSLLLLTLQADSDANQTIVECLIVDLANDSLNVYVNSSGNSNIIAKYYCLCSSCSSSCTFWLHLCKRIPPCYDHYSHFCLDSTTGLRSRDCGGLLHCLHLTQPIISSKFQHCIFSSLERYPITQCSLPFEHHCYKLCWGK